MLRIRYLGITLGVALILALAFVVGLAERPECSTGDATDYWTESMWAMEPTASYWAELGEGKPDLPEIALRHQRGLRRLRSIEPPPCLQGFHDLTLEEWRLEAGAFEAAVRGDHDEAAYLFRQSAVYFDLAYEERDRVAQERGW